VQAFIQQRGVTMCRPGMASGTGYNKPTATGIDSRESFLHRQPAQCNEENLAKAKILTMIQDLAGKGFVEPSQKLKIKNAAYRFFFNPSEQDELEAWCDTAGLDPDFVREKAREVHENGWPAWRAAAGAGKGYETRKQYRAKNKRKGGELV
jgi:hypothetical protein